jgi:hypothetical protein
MGLNLIRQETKQSHTNWDRDLFEQVQKGENRDSILSWVE